MGRDAGSREDVGGEEGGGVVQQREEGPAHEGSEEVRLPVVADVPVPLPNQVIANPPPPVDPNKDTHNNLIE